MEANALQPFTYDGADRDTPKDYFRKAIAANFMPDPARVPFLDINIQTCLAEKGHLEEVKDYLFK